MNLTMQISVVICTFNRANSLKDTLESLLVQNLDGIFDYEIIVVDNNSKDATKSIVYSYMPKFQGRLSYVLETSQGLSNARNRGIKEAKGSIIAFTDDDVIIDKNWLSNIWACLQSNDYQAMGGRILPLYNPDTPKWIKDNSDLLGGPIVRHDYGEINKSYAKETMSPFVGANMAFSRKVFDKYGLFRADLGVGQGKVGEDTEFFKRVIEKEKICYCGKALVWHKVEKKRSNLAYIAKWWMLQGRYAVAEDYGKGESRVTLFFGIPRYIFRETIINAAALLSRVFDRRKFVKTWKKISWDIGRIMEYRKIYICSKYQ